MWFELIVFPEWHNYNSVRVHAIMLFHYALIRGSCVKCYARRAVHRNRRNYNRYANSGCCLAHWVMWMNWFPRQVTPPEDARREPRRREAASASFSASSTFFLGWGGRPPRERPPSPASVFVRSLFIPSPLLFAHLFAPPYPVPSLVRVASIYISVYPSPSSLLSPFRWCYCLFYFVFSSLILILHLL
jgi:hypothetical protein